MSLALFSTDGLLFALRWMHFFFGIVWIGHLYYLNFVQGAFMAETEAATKSQVFQKLLPRVMWWFRWGAMYTLLTGLSILAIRGHMQGIEVFVTGWGAQILIGATLGIFMWANVWFVIWPRQKIIIANAENVAKGQPANPAIATLAGESMRASRTNVLFSIPMLFFMGAGRHLPVMIDSNASFACLALTVGAVIVALELNALFGKLGPLTTVKGVITSGFALSAVLYAIVEIIL